MTFDSQWDGYLYKKSVESVSPGEVVRLALTEKLNAKESALFVAMLQLIGEAVNKIETEPFVPPSPYLSLGDAADLIGLNKRTLLNTVSEAKRRGREFDWVLRQGRKRGFVVDRAKFIAWIEKRAGRIGRPRQYNV